MAVAITLAEAFILAAYRPAGPAPPLPTRNDTEVGPAGTSVAHRPATGDAGHDTRSLRPIPAPAAAASFGPCATPSSFSGRPDPSGPQRAIDHLAVQPFRGVFLNALNRFILPRIDTLDGYELLANLSLAAAVGLLLVAVTDRTPDRSGPG
jgi:hypothetical protein